MGEATAAERDTRSVAALIGDASRMIRAPLRNPVT
jgi:hypothetical protein